MNCLAPAGFALSIAASLLTVFSALCVFGLILNSTVGAIVGIVACAISAAVLVLYFVLFK